MSELPQSESQRFRRRRSSSTRTRPSIRPCGLIGEGGGGRACWSSWRPSSSLPVEGGARRAAGFAGWNEFGSASGRTASRLGPLTERLVEVCREHGVYCAIGVNERESDRPGLLYNTLLVPRPRACCTSTEADADYARAALPRNRRGDDLAERHRGRALGGLICWENLMPLARYAVYRQGPRSKSHRPPTTPRAGSQHAPGRDRVGRLRGIGAAVHPRPPFPATSPVPGPRARRCSATAARRSSRRSRPGHRRPFYGEEGIVVATVTSARLVAKRLFDAWPLQP